ncbi:nitric oxide-sensing protein NosP [Paraburkholderia sp.]|uniref:nitric oxide-sensing protein NosP n=1 Tax=Paraburkholderia sp. TaxID=1926495 RepID=UPI0025D195D8|nr:nitric oxide-sensing protein NosP [Paraburkholderia sp.]
MPPVESSSIVSAHSTHPDARAAVREVGAALAVCDAELVIFYCSSHFDLDALASEIHATFGQTRVIGCTTAGEIGPAGYLDHSLSAVALPRALFTAAITRIDNLRDFTIAGGQACAINTLNDFEKRASHASASNSFALLLVDGLSVREEPVARTLQNALGDIPLVGGSAGDDLRFERTAIFHDGSFRTDCAVLVVASTSLPFRTFKTQHFLRCEERLVVTGADAPRRTVYEINGLPAAKEYARLIGASADELCASHFASAPVVVLIDGADYVRSIQKLNPDGSLTFYCAIEEGLVLRVARALDLVGNLRVTFDDLRNSLGEPQLALTYDCILRHLEMTQRGTRDEAAALYKANHAVGFSTYGEQYRGVHVNQTLTGIVFGNEARTASV